MELLKQGVEQGGSKTGTKLQNKHLQPYVLERKTKPFPTPTYAEKQNHLTHLSPAQCIFHSVLCANYSKNGGSSICTFSYFVNAVI